MKVGGRTYSCAGCRQDSQLGVTEAVINGTADEATMLNYYNRTIEPMLGAIAEAMRRSFLTKTARAQYQTIVYFRDPFKYVPIASMADLADKLTRNEVLSANELRSGMGFRPSKNPKADELRNANMPIPPEPVQAKPESSEKGDGQNGSQEAGL